MLGPGLKQEVDEVFRFARVGDTVGCSRFGLRDRVAGQVGRFDDLSSAFNRNAVLASAFVSLEP